MRVRISTVQYQHRPIHSFDQFAERIRADVQFARDSGSHLAVFPEYLTGELLTIEPNWDRWTQPYRELFAGLARDSGLYVLGGTHLVREGGRLFNAAHLFTPGGQIHTQHKLHLTPCEVNPWDLATGEEVTVFETELGRLAVLVCFDVEFPEAARAAVDAGGDLLLVPSCTDDRAGFWRVRYCCHARTVEHQVCVVHSALVGGLPAVRYLEQSFGRSGVLSPCDIPFSPNGVVADGEFGQHMVVTGDVDLTLLAQVREAGSVTPRLCRRGQYGSRNVSLLTP